MKKTILLSLSFLMAAQSCGLSFGEEQEKKKREGSRPAARQRGPMPEGGPAPFLAQNFERMDANGDGLIDEEEFLAPVRQRFLQIDTNGDGNVDRQEMMAAREQMMNQFRGGPGPFGPPGDRPPGPPEGRPEGRPRPGDAGNRGPMEDRIRQFMQQTPRDAQGRVSLADMPEPMQNRLAHLDTNEDGFIDPEEAKSLMARLEYNQERRKKPAEAGEGRGERGRRGEEQTGPQKPKRPAQEPGKDDLSE